jgi:tetrapyrrole methylase family protein/MazG family protein
MDRLLAPDGCPWDREQTHESLKQYLIEESYEVHDAIESGDMDHLCEELGDVALQVVFHAALAKRAGHFDVAAVLDGICEKLVRRHPHVFGETTVSGSGQVLENWEQIKKRERAGKKADDSLVAGIPPSLPALQKAHRMQDKVRRVGFDWPNVHGALDKVREEFEELAVEVAAAETPAQCSPAPAAAGQPAPAPKAKPQPTPCQVEEMGDLLFSLVNVARLMGIQPEEALQKACAKFAHRFRHIERRAAETGRALESMTLDEMDVFWNEAKHDR